MARMTWNVSFDFKPLRIPKSRVTRRGVFSRKWMSRKVKDVDSSESSTSPPPSREVKSAVLTTIVPISAPQAPVITIPDPSANTDQTASDEAAGSAAEEVVTEIEIEDKVSEFTCFPDLPAELRCKIWKAAAFIPRNVNIWSCDFGKKISIPLNDNEDEAEGDVLVIWKLCSTTTIPTILQVCKESRTEALKHYKLDFGTSYTFRDFTFTTHPRIYFNFEVDRLCLMESFEGENSRACKNFFDRLLSNGTRYIALDVKRFQDDPKRECTYIRPFLTRCMDRKTNHSIESIVLASPEYTREMRGVIEFKDCAGTEDDSENVNMVILKSLEDWVREKETAHEGLDTGSGVEIEFKTLVINGKECTE